MKNLMIKPGILVALLLLVAFLGACPGDEGEPEGGKVIRPTLTASPNNEGGGDGKILKFNDAAITITLTTTPADAKIYYTTDGSTPTASSTLYNGPFALGPFNSVTTPYKGQVVLKAIGIKNGYENSTELSQKFQIFEKVGPYSSQSGPYTGPVTGGPSAGYNNGTLNVTLTLRDGFITGLTYQDGINGIFQTASEPYWQRAQDYANKFVPLMNSGDFDVVSSATGSSRGISAAVKLAIAKIPTLP